ncbi:MAG TPA: GNAT family N-acetyltransferase, partial [Streptosporangiaceae bacterium]|nr:GNAT family N-acetyltransferase [Streptosporangiaceae bacterium]
MTGSEVAVRRLGRADLPLVCGWLAEPHVARWWQDPSDLDSVEASYLPAIEGRDPTEIFVIEVAGRAAGLIQRYLTADDPSWERAIAGTGAVGGVTAGIDYLIGEPGLTGRGYGTAAIALFTSMSFQRYPEAQAVVAVPQQANVASCRAL